MSSSKLTPAEHSDSLSLPSLPQSTSEIPESLQEPLTPASVYVTAPGTPATTVTVVIHSNPGSKYLDCSPYYSSNFDPDDDVPQLVLPPPAHTTPFIWELPGQPTYIPDTTTVCGRTPDEWVESKKKWQLWELKEQKALIRRMERRWTEEVATDEALVDEAVVEAAVDALLE